MPVDLVLQVRARNPATRLGRRNRVKAIVHAEEGWYKRRGGARWFGKLSTHGEAPAHCAHSLPPSPPRLALRRGHIALWTVSCTACATRAGCVCGAVERSGLGLGVISSVLAAQRPCRHACFLRGLHELVLSSVFAVPCATDNTNWTSVVKGAGAKANHPGTTYPTDLMPARGISDMPVMKVGCALARIV